MFRWKMKIFSYTSFCWILTSFTLYALSDEEFSFFCTSFFTIPCLKHVSQGSWNLVICQPLVREFHHPPNLILSYLPQFLIWIQYSLHNLVFGILINRTRMSPKTWHHMDGKLLPYMKSGLNITHAKQYWSYYVHIFQETTVVSFLP